MQRPKMTALRGWAGGVWEGLERHSGQVGEDF